MRRNDAQHLPPMLLNERIVPAKGGNYEKVLSIILTVICGLLANLIAAVPAAWTLLSGDNVVSGVLVGLLIACGLGALLNLIGRKLEEECLIARRALFLIAQAPFVVLMAALFIQNAVELHSSEPSLGDMFSGLYGWGLELNYYVYLGALATAVMTIVAAFVIFAVAGKKPNLKKEKQNERKNRTADQQH